jgi:hypothetical protein
MCITDNREPGARLPELSCCLGSTTSQLVRTAFQSTMGSHKGVPKGAFSAERGTSGCGWGPSTGGGGGGAGEVRGADGWVPDPPGHATPGYALEKSTCPPKDMQWRLACVGW